MKTIRETLLLFMRFPEPGKVKSRLAAALGEESALAVYTRLVRRTLGVAADFKRLRPGAEIHLFFSPADKKERFASSYPGPRDFIAQEGAHLGERMERAFLWAREKGFDRAVMVGSDIADLAASDLDEAFEALASGDAVLGPASDGGFYLIGLKSRSGNPGVSIFRHERWGTEEIFRRTRDELLRSGLSVRLVAKRCDIDTPGDALRLGASRGAPSAPPDSRSHALPAETPETPGASSRAAPAMLPDGPSPGSLLFASRLTIVIPTLGPPERLRPLLDTLEAGLWPGDSIIVVHGGPDSERLESADRVEAPGSGTRWIASPPGRGVQMNRGAGEATGDVLWFLHGDSTPPPHFAYQVRKILEAPRASFGCFHLGFLPSTPLLEAIARWANFRTRRLKLPYGDQGFFCRRETFVELGGFQKRFIMEDVDFAKRARSRGELLLLPDTLYTSPGRYLEKGVLRASLQNHLLRFLHFLGVEDEKLYALYYGKARTRPRASVAPAGSGADAKP